MNERAAELGLEDTHYANPIGLRRPGQLLDRRATSRRSLGCCCKNDALRRHRRPPAAVLRAARATASIDNRNRPRAHVPVRRRRQDRPHARRRLRARRVGRAATARGDQRRARRAERGGARRRLARAAALRASTSSGASRRSKAGRASSAPRSSYFDDGASRSRRAVASRSPCAAARRCAARVDGSGRARGAAAGGRAGRTASSCSCDGKVVERACRSSPPPRCRRPSVVREGAAPRSARASPL